MIPVHPSIIVLVIFLCVALAGYYYTAALELARSEKRCRELEELLSSGDKRVRRAIDILSGKEDEVKP